MIDRQPQQQHSSGQVDQSNSLSQTSRWNWLWPTTALALCPLVLLFLIASIIVLSLIPTFLARNSSTDGPLSSLSGAAGLSYATGLNDSTLPKIANLDDLSQRLSNEFDVPGIRVRAAAFSQSRLTSGGRKRRLTSVDYSDCRTDPDTRGALLRIEFYFIYPAAFRTPARRRTYEAEVQRRIAVLKRKFVLLLTFTNGQTLSVVVNLCSYTPDIDTTITTTIPSSTSTIANTTISSNNSTITGTTTSSANGTTTSGTLGTGTTPAPTSGIPGTGTTPAPTSGTLGTGTTPAPTLDTLGTGTTPAPTSGILGTGTTPGSASDTTDTSTMQSST